MRGSLLVTFLGMGLATYLTRATLTVTVPRGGLPPFWERFLEAIPLAALTALVVPALWPPSGTAVGSPWPALAGAVATLALIRATRNLIVAAGAGTIVYLLLLRLT